MRSFRWFFAIRAHARLSSGAMVTRLVASSILGAAMLSMSSLAVAESEQDTTDAPETTGSARETSAADAPPSSKRLFDAEEGEGSDIDDGTRDLDRWVPSFSVLSGILVEDASANVSSDVRPSASGSTSFVSPFVVGSFEVVSPRLIDRFADPRAFVHADIGGLFGIEKDVAKEGAPGPFIPPATPPVNTDEAIAGQGSATRVQPRPFLFMAGAGISFRWNLGERVLRIKPSFEYLREEMRVSGIVKRAYVVSPTVPSFSYVTLSSSKDVVFHGFGPGIGIEADVARWKSMAVGLLASAQYYWIMNDGVVQLTDTEGSDTAQWNYSKGLHAVRATIGMRFSWSPED